MFPGAMEKFLFLSSRSQALSSVLCQEVAGKYKGCMVLHVFPGEGKEMLCDPR